MKYHTVVPYLKNEDKTFQLRLHIGWRSFLLEQRALTGKKMKDIVEELLVDHFNHNPAESEV